MSKQFIPRMFWRFLVMLVDKECILGDARIICICIDAHTPTQVPGPIINVCGAGSSIELAQQALIRSLSSIGSLFSVQAMERKPTEKEMLLYRKMNDHIEMLPEDYAHLEGMSLIACGKLRRTGDNYEKNQ